MNDARYLDALALLRRAHAALAYAGHTDAADASHAIAVFLGRAELAHGDAIDQELSDAVSALEDEGG